MRRTLLAALACGTALAPLAAPAAPPAPARPAEAAAVERVAYSRTVERVQEGLNALGYDAGPEDGLMGNRTRQAIRAYQRDQNLPVTGEASQRLVGHLQSRIAAGASRDPSEDWRDEDWRRAPAPTAEADQSLVLDTQGQLRRMGHDLRLTGRLDPATREAIGAYQRDQGLMVTGEPSPALLAHMRDGGRDGGTVAAGHISAETVARVQAALNDRGYDAGPPDGVLGPGTRSAIRTYQADAGLPVNGAVTIALLERLNAMPGGAPPSQTASPGTEPAGLATWRTVFSDGFDQAASLAGTRWRAVLGDVRLAEGALVTDVAAPQQQAPEEVGRDLLKSVLGQALGVQVPGGQQADRAVAARPARLDGAFRMQAEIAASDTGTGQGRVQPQVNLGVFSGEDAASGYRLLYVGESPRPWRLVRNSGQQVATLASASAGPSLADGGRHRLDWERDAEGAMTVTVDGTTVLSTGGDQGAGTESFDGVSLINGGGTWRLHEMTVETLED